MFCCAFIFLFNYFRFVFLIVYLSIFYDLIDSFINFQKRKIKSSTSKIENDKIIFSGFLIHSVCNGSSVWLINNSKKIESCNQTGILNIMNVINPICNSVIFTISRAHNEFIKSFFDILLFFILSNILLNW